MVLNDLSVRLLKGFSRSIQLIVHGSAVMVLHPMLSSLTTRQIMRGIKVIMRSFAAEMGKLGVFDAEARLQSCVNTTAAYYHLGTDWLNSHPVTPMLHFPWHKSEFHKSFHIIQINFYKC
jgi:hypothetical protein